jgi:hypothetical protein
MLLDHEEVQVAVLTRIPPRPRAEEHDSRRGTRGCRQPLSCIHDHRVADHKPYGTESCPRTGLTRVAMDGKLLLGEGIDPASPIRCRVRTLDSNLGKTGLTGRLSKHDPTWDRIHDLHAQRFGPKSGDDT